MACYFQILAGWVMALLAALVAMLATSYVGAYFGTAVSVVWAVLTVIMFAVIHLGVVIVTSTPSDNGPRTLGPMYGATATGLGLTLLVVGMSLLASTVGSRGPLAFILPYVGVGVVITLSAVVSVVRARRIIQRFKDRDSRVCPRCDYLREGLAEGAVCPECGGPPPAVNAPASSSQGW